VEDQLFAVLESQRAKAVPEPVDGGIVRRPALDDDADLIDAGRLCLGCEGHCQEAEGAREEISPLHYWMISSARASTDGGMVSPSAFAVLRLSANDNTEACSIGSSPGAAPLKMRSM